MKRSLDVLLISMHYWPEPCDTRTSQLAKSLVRRGHRATVLTSFPNYPFGRVYEGYSQRPWKRETIEGVNVVRVPMFPDHSKSVKRRALSYASFAASASLFGPFLVGRPDLVWIHHPPLTTGLAGWWVSQLIGAPFVYEVHDLWPETLVSSGMVRESKVTAAIRKACDALHDWSAAVVVTSPGMKSHLVSQGVARDKLHVLPQWADEGALLPVERNAAFGEEFGLTRKFNVMFTGNVGAAQELDTVLDTAARMRGVEGLQFVVVGAGLELERLQARATAEDLHNVLFLGQHPRELMPHFFSWADALLVTLRDDPLFAITVPSKLQAYLHAGRPVLCGRRGRRRGRRLARGLRPDLPAGRPVRALASAVQIVTAMAQEERDADRCARGRRYYDHSFSQDSLVGRVRKALHRHRPPSTPDARSLPTPNAQPRHQSRTYVLFFEFIH